MGLDFVSFHVLDSDLAAVGLDLVSFSSIYSKINSFRFVLGSGKMGLGQAEQHCTFRVHVYKFFYFTVQIPGALLA